MDRVLALFPDSLNVKIQRGYIEFFWKGSTAPIKAALESLPGNVDPDGVVTFGRWDVALMDRNPAAAAKALAACRLDTITSQTGAPLPKSYLQGCIDLVRGDATQAKANFEAARPALVHACRGGEASHQPGCDGHSCCDPPAYTPGHCHLLMFHATRGMGSQIVRSRDRRGWVWNCWGS